MSIQTKLESSKWIYKDKLDKCNRRVDKIIKLKIEIKVLFNL